MKLFFKAIVAGFFLCPLTYAGIPGISATLEPSTQRCEDTNKISLIITNNSTNPISCRATYEKKKLKEGVHLSQDVNPYVNFTVPAKSTEIIFCLEKVKKGRLTNLKQVSIGDKTLNGEALTNTSQINFVIPE